MSRYELQPDELRRLEDAHKKCYSRREADRIKAVILLSKGWPPTQVAEALLMDRGTVREHFRRYEKGGLDRLTRLEYQGSESYLNDVQLLELAKELDDHIYATTAEVIELIEGRWNVRYSERGVNSLLHRIGFVYKKTKAVPGKADAEQQEAFLETYKELKQQKAPQDPIYFANATHPQHNTQPGYAWVRQGEERQVKSSTGRQRLNINGAIDVQTLSAVVRYEDTVNADAAIGLFQAIEAKHPDAEKIYVICDNARYYRSKLAQAYLKTSRVVIVFLPPYSPNLNLIERLWKFFKKNVLYNRYYERFDQFRDACESFFENLGDYRRQLQSLLAENFEIVSA